MASWDSYPQKGMPEDADTVLIKDTAGAANKRVSFSAIWTWIKGKLGGAALKNVANNCTTTEDGSVLDARQGKILADDIADKLDKSSVKNNCTTTEAGNALDARQGKALADMIGDLDDLDTTAKGSLVAAINEQNSKTEIITLTDEDLNLLCSPSYLNRTYTASGDNSCTNKPNGVDSFGGTTLRFGSGSYTQILWSGFHVYIRQYSGGSATSWREFTSSVVS
jgi:hypothetical protein